ncbi:hypothetical protein Csa_023512, partial [Cucumis sativus]
KRSLRLSDLTARLEKPFSPERWYFVNRYHHQQITKTLRIKCRSHGQSQEVKAATLLHKAMEYDTNSRWRFQTGAINIDNNFFVTLTPVIYEHNAFAPYLVKDWIYNPPSHKQNK